MMIPFSLLLNVFKIFSFLSSAFVGIIAWSGSVGTEKLEPKKSCREHYLNGISNDAVVPLIGSRQSEDPFWLECKFPQFSSRSLDSNITTVVHNALERFSPLGSEKRTIEYQIRDWHFLQQLLSESGDCTQQLHIQWPNRAENTNEALRVNGGGYNDQLSNKENDDLVVFSKGNREAILRKNKAMEFKVESLDGNLSTFTMNYTNIDFQSVDIVLLESKQLPVMHIHPPAKSLSEDQEIKIRLTTLMCRKKVIDDKNCFFDMSSDNEFIRFNVPSSAKKYSSAKTFVFAFRTSRHNGTLISLEFKEDFTIDVDLFDGYLVMANHIIHPVSLLADGNWHTAYLDVLSLSLRFDNLQTSILLRSSFSMDGRRINDAYGLAAIDILVNGEVTAIRLEPTDSDHDSNWFCLGSEFLTVQRSSSSPYKIKVCSPNEEEISSCNCQGPNSALSLGIGIAACSAPKPENAFHLSRYSDKLAFFMIPNFNPNSTISILFKSESETGLLFFGTASSDKRNVHQRTLSDRNSISSVRIQAHFVGKTMYVASCQHMVNNEERCHSCSIVHSKEINSGDWIRMSLFYLKNYQFMSLGGQVCRLSPNSEILDSSELYKVSQSVSSVLFVGGTYYTKSLQNVKEDFKRDYHENTREKSYSLEGCIAEVRLGGQIVDLDNVLKEQIEKVISNGDRTSFSIEQGCNNCPQRCAGAACSISSHSSETVCRCSNIYAAMNPNSGECRTTFADGFSDVNAGLPVKQALRLSLSSSNDELVTEMALEDLFKIPIEISSRLYRLRKVEKIWLLLRLPELNSEMHTFVTFGNIVKLSVGENGKRLVVEMPDYEIREEFLLMNSEERLHLISIEAKPSIGTALEMHPIIIRLDQQIRHLFIDEFIPSESLKFISIFPYVIESNDENDVKIDDIGGCFSEVGVNYAFEGEGSSKFIAENNQIDYLTIITQKLGQKKTMAKIKSSILIEKSKCGIRDPLLWSGNSSSYGRLTEYNPSGNYSRSLWPRLIIIVFLALIILLLVVYCCSKLFGKNRKKYRPNGVAENELASSDEKRPLKSGDEQKLNLSLSNSNTDTTYEDQQDGSSIPSKPRHSEEAAEPLIIDKLKSSPRSGKYNRIQQPPIINRQASPAFQTISTAPLSLSSSTSDNSPYSFPSTISSSAQSPASTSAVVGMSPSVETRPSVRIAFANMHPGAELHTAPVVSHHEL